MSLYCFTKDHHSTLFYDSNIDARTYDEFISKCGSKGPTVSFIMHGSVFFFLLFSRFLIFFCVRFQNVVAGTTFVSWEKSSLERSKYFSDPKSSLIRLSPNPALFSIDQREDCAICVGDRYGPCFGFFLHFLPTFHSFYFRRGCTLFTYFCEVSPDYPSGMRGNVRDRKFYKYTSFDLPQDDFLFPKTQENMYPIDSIVVFGFKHPEMHGEDTEPASSLILSVPVFFFFGAYFVSEASSVHPAWTSPALLRVTVRFAIVPFVSWRQTTIGCVRGRLPILAICSYENCFGYNRRSCLVCELCFLQHSISQGKRTALNWLLRMLGLLEPGEVAFQDTTEGLDMFDMFSFLT